MSEPHVTAEHPRAAWDEQRAAVLDAMRRGRRAAWWGGGCAAVVAMCVAGVLGAGWSAALPVCACAGLAALATWTVAQRIAGRGVGHELRKGLARSGHQVTVEQARLLLRLGTCWAVDQSCLVADFSQPDRVVVVVAPPPPGRDGTAGTSGDAGGTSWGGDAGGGGGGGDGGGGC